MYRALPYSLFSLSLAAVAASQNTLSVTVSSLASQATISVSQQLSPGYAGFGIEPSNLFSYTGWSRPNDLSINLITNLAAYSGSPPHIRLGGNTGDYMIFDPAYSDYGFQVNENPVASGSVGHNADLYIIGPTFYKVMNRLPKGTPVTYGLNMAYDLSDWPQRIVAQANAALDGMSDMSVVSFEIGNEPDLWLQNGFRTGTWGGPTYVQQWLERASTVYKQVLEPRGLPTNFFEPGCTANTIGTTFQINVLDKAGVTANADGHSTGYVAAFNQHDYYYFIGVSGYQLTLNMLMDLSTTANQFADWTRQVTESFVAGYPYVLREFAAVGPIGIQGISDTFGAALFTLNFFLYAANLNISSVEFHMTDNSYGSPWQPIKKAGMGPVGVRPTYYSIVAMAQLLGAGNGTTQVSQFIPLITGDTLPGPYNDHVGGYYIYRQGALGSIVLINSLPANASNPSKGSLTFQLSLPGYENQLLYLSTLTAEGADSVSNVTFNGLSFEVNGDGTPSTVDGTAYTINIDASGSATVPVRDSQAVIANIGFLLGSQPVAVVNETSDPNVHPTIGGTTAVSIPSSVVSGVVSTGGATPSPAAAMAVSTSLEGPAATDSSRASADSSQSTTHKSHASSSTHDGSGAAIALALALAFACLLCG